MLGFITSYIFFNTTKFDYFYFAIKQELLIIKKKIIFTFPNIIYLFWYCLQAKGLIDYVYNRLIVKPILNFSYQICYIELDRGWLEFFFVKMPTKILFFFGWIFNKNTMTTLQMFLPAMIFITTLWITIISILLK